MSIANDPHLPSCGINTRGECDCGEWDPVPFDLPPAKPCYTHSNVCDAQSAGTFVERPARKQSTFVDRPLRALLIMAIASAVGGCLGWALAGVYIWIWG